MQTLFIENKKNPDGQPQTAGKLALNKADIERLGAAAVLAGGFGRIAADIRKKDLNAFDKKISREFKQLSNPLLDRYFGLFKFIGSQQATFGVNLLSVLWLWRQKKTSEALFMLAGVNGVWGLNKILKYAFRRNRPVKPEKPGQHEQRNSFPSGHVALSCCQYLMLARLGWRSLKSPLTRTVWVLLMLNMAISVGLSRIYLRKHHPSDVIGAYLLAASCLLLLITAEDLYERKRSEAQQ